MLFGMTRRIVQRSTFTLLYSDFKFIIPSVYCRKLVLAVTPLDNTSMKLLKVNTTLYILVNVNRKVKLRKKLE